MKRKHTVRISVDNSTQRWLQKWIEPCLIWDLKMETDCHCFGILDFMLYPYVNFRNQCYQLYQLDNQIRIRRRFPLSIWLRTVIEDWKYLPLQNEICVVNFLSLCFRIKQKLEILASYFWRVKVFLLLFRTFLFQ